MYGDTMSKSAVNPIMKSDPRPMTLIEGELEGLTAAARRVEEVVARLEERLGSVLNRCTRLSSAFWIVSNCEWRSRSESHYRICGRGVGFGCRTRTVLVLR